MGLKINIKPSLLKIKELPDEISKRFGRDLKDELEGAIQDEIMSGNSPVRGHRWEEYSEEYAKRKGFKRPNMFLTGKMLKSLKITQDTDGNVVIRFDDEKAEWHNSGAGTLPKRKLLPTDSGDTFNVKLTKLIRKILELAVKTTTRRR